MSDSVAETQEMTVILTVEHLEEIIRKVIREELIVTCDCYCSANC